MEIGCLLPENTSKPLTPHNQQHNTNIVFVTDPICSHCWAIEPMWRRLRLNFSFTYRYIHGGLLPGWQHFNDPHNSISKPSDVAIHWQHVSEHFKQPINPNIWLEDPIDNSIILCKAVLVMRVLAPQLEAKFLRGMREQIFLYAENLAKENKLLDYIENFTVNKNDFQQLLHDKRIHQLFLNEQQEMIQLKSRGFPSLIMLSNPKNIISGARDYSLLASALLASFPNIERKNLTATEKLNYYESWTLREASEVLQCTENEAKKTLTSAGFLAVDIADSKLFKQS